MDLLGYCIEGDQRLLAYEFATMGSLHDILHGMHLSHLADMWHLEIKQKLFMNKHEYLLKLLFFSSFQQEEKVLQVHNLDLLLTGCKESKLLLMLQKVLNIFMRRCNLPLSIEIYGLAMFFYLRTTRLKLQTSIFQANLQIWLLVFILLASSEPSDTMLQSNYLT